MCTFNDNILFSFRITGFITMKIGKVAAVGLGGGVILLHIASQKGYIDINWDKINKRVDKISDKIEKETTGKSADWFEKVIAAFDILVFFNSILNIIMSCVLVSNDSIYVACAWGLYSSSLSLLLYNVNKMLSIRAALCSCYTFLLDRCKKNILYINNGYTKMLLGWVTLFMYSCLVYLSFLGYSSQSC